jgi:uncharacterized membrane protein
MDQTTELALVVAAGVGLLATMLILNRERRESAGAKESPFAVSTEGEKRCLKCGMGNLTTSDTCANCGAKLPG